jgi:hypothetical protein
MTPEDAWDGLILRYALEIGDTSGWLAGLDESGWEIFQSITSIQLAIASSVGSDYFFGYKVLVSIAILVLANETHKLISALFMVGPSWANFGVALTLTNPVWTAASGSVMMIHVLAIPAALAGVRILMTPKWTAILSIPLLALAFEID